MTAQVSPTLLATDRTSPVGDLFIDNDQQGRILALHSLNRVVTAVQIILCLRAIMFMPTLHLKIVNARLKNFPAVSYSSGVFMMFLKPKTSSAPSTIEPSRISSPKPRGHLNGTIS